MAADPEFLEPTGMHLWDDPAFASDAQMALLLGLDLPIAPQPGEEIFIPDLESRLMPQPNAVNFGSNERSIAEVVYAFGYVAARLAHQRKLLDYSPARDTDFDPFAPFTPPLMQEAVEAARNAVRLQDLRLQRGRIRINAMGGHVLNLVLAYGAKPDVRLFDMHNALGAGAVAMENMDAIHDEREAFERAMAEEARLLTVPIGDALDTSGSSFTLNDGPAVKNETVTRQQILAAYEDGVDGYDAKTRKVDIGRFPAALRLVAMQNVVAAHLDTLGELPDDAKLYTVEEAEQLLAARDFDKKRGVIQLVGDVTFNPRSKLLSVAGKESLDAKFNVPGLTRRVVLAALALMAESEQRPIPEPRLMPTEPIEEVSAPEVTAAPEHVAPEETDETVSPIAPSYEVAREQFINRLAALLEGNLPNEGAIQALYEAIASYDESRDINILGQLFNCSHTIGRTDTFHWIRALRDEMRVWPKTPGQGRRNRAGSQGAAPPDRPTFAARVGARKRNGSARAQQAPRQRTDQ